MIIIILNDSFAIAQGMDIAVDPDVKEVLWQQVFLSHRTLFSHYFQGPLSLDWHIFHSFCGNQKYSKLRLLKKKNMVEQYHLY